MAAQGLALAYPKPAAVPQRWELNFEPGPLRIYVDPAESSAFWYFTYKVTNRTGREQTWAPDLTLFTDGGEIVAAGRGVPSRVSEDVIKLLGKDFLETQNEVIGEILHLEWILPAIV